MFFLTLSYVIVRFTFYKKKYFSCFRENTDALNITYLPYYGGAKGQTLKLIYLPDGTIKSEIVNNTDIKENAVSNDIQLIHESAHKIVKLEELAKTKGELSEEEQKLYNENMDILNLSVKNLADTQQEQVEEELNDEGLSRSENLQFWFEKKKANFRAKPTPGNKNEQEKEEQGKEEEKEEQEEENVGEEENGEIDEGVAINLPPKDAAVAEAKPLGIAIAGRGGVAASKPIATAIVGPAGLAIARPVATAIAGLPAEEAISILNEGYLKSPPKQKGKKPSKNKSPEICDKEDGKEEPSKMKIFAVDNLPPHIFFDN